MKNNPFVEYILYDIFEERDMITTRSMMGGYILYKEGKVFGLAEDDELYLKCTKGNEFWFLERGSKKFSYEKRGKNGTKKIQEMGFFLVPETVLEKKEELEEWVYNAGIITI
jgi:TfoX/Sxy family transcriptional regulator of competence genes